MDTCPSSWILHRFRQLSAGWTVVIPTCISIVFRPLSGKNRITYHFCFFFYQPQYCNRRSQWPRGLRRRFSAARLLRLCVRIPPGIWMFVCCKYCVSSGRGPCDGLITCPEESYRLWRVVVCDLETSKMRRLKPATGLWKYNQRVVTPRKQTYMVCRS